MMIRTTTFCHMGMFKGSVKVSTLNHPRQKRKVLTLRISSRSRNVHGLAIGELDSAADLDLGLGHLDPIEGIPFQTLDMVDVGFGIHDTAELLVLKAGCCSLLMGADEVSRPGRPRRNKAL
jgi:hypothetical protein